MTPEDHDRFKTAAADMDGAAVSLRQGLRRLEEDVLATLGPGEDAAKRAAAPLRDAHAAVCMCEEQIEESRRCLARLADAAGDSARRDG